MIDFEIPDETKLVRAQVREFVQSVCIPAEKNLSVETFDDILAELRQKARAQGLWCPFFPVEWGGYGTEAAGECPCPDGVGRVYAGGTRSQYAGSG